MSWFGKKTVKRNYKEGEPGFNSNASESDFLSNDPEKIMAVIESLPDGILIFDANKNLSLINSRAQSVLEISGAQMLGKNILELSRYRLCQSLVSILGGGLKEFEGEKIQLKNNLILEASSRPLAVGGKKSGTLVVLKDISEKESIEKVKSEFITVAAHKLRTPTSAIKWISEELIGGDMGELSFDQKEEIKKISQANERIIDLVNKLLSSAELEGGKYLSKPALFDIEEIILSVANDFKDAVKKNKMEIKLEKSEDKLPKIMVDKEKIKLAISDFIDNAVKYNKPGGKINIYLAKKGEDIVVAVKDMGIGISQKERDKIFLKFFRGDRALKIDTEGKGLGLFIAKSIIEEHGGSVWFESKEGFGSTFFFSLPIKEKFGEYITNKFY